VLSRNSHRGFALIATLAAVALAASGLSGTAAAEGEVKVIELTQVGCQFLESEHGVDHGFQTARQADCNAINARTGTERLSKSKTIRLAPGKYILRVTRKNVPYDLGFWLRGDGLVERVALPSVSGGGLSKGKSRDYVIQLKPGKYVYSCPLNPTPDYRLEVSAG
jgi:hypothetical protein